MKIPREVILFLEQQGCVVVSTMDQKKNIHCSVKGIVGIDPDGKIFVIDLYFHKTYANLKKNSTISITAVNEKKFKGYSLQGTAKMISRENIKEHLVEKWENKIIKRASERLIEGVQSGSKSKGHFEIDLPKQPKYLMEVDVTQIIDLRPSGLRGKRGN